MIKIADTEYDVHHLVSSRWSPLAFLDKPVKADELRALFEAARWSPSCYNDQPWNFIYALRKDNSSFERLLETLVPQNQEWARQAPVLVISVARKAFRHNGQPNSHSWHDIGLATALLALQATAQGLCVHIMAGFDKEKARATLGIPESFEPVSAIAIGYSADPAVLPERLQARENAPRTRLLQDSFVFHGSWGESRS
jgi:nitroreductase